MFLVCLLLIGLIGFLITTEKKSQNAKQVELIPIRVESRKKIN